MRYIKYLVLLSALMVLPAAYSQAQVDEGFHSFNGPDHFREDRFRTFGSERASRDDYRGYRGGDSYGDHGYRHGDSDRDHGYRHGD